MSIKAGLRRFFLLDSPPAQEAPDVASASKESGEDEGFVIGGPAVGHAGPVGIAPDGKLVVGGSSSFGPFRGSFD